MSCSRRSTLFWSAAIMRGIDQRFIDECVDEEISIGDFVLTGGEIPAMAVTDAVCRMVPGVLPDEEAFTAESHWDGLLEHPAVHPPENWRGREVPEVLLSGHHANIEAWRREMSLRRTKRIGPTCLHSLSRRISGIRRFLIKLTAMSGKRTLRGSFCCANAKESLLTRTLFPDSSKGKLCVCIIGLLECGLFVRKSSFALFSPDASR